MSVTLKPLTQLPGATVSAFDGGDNTQKIRRIYFQVVPAGAYAGTPGDPMDFTTLGDFAHSEFAPLFVAMQSAKPGGVTGYDYSYVPNAAPTLINGTFQVIQCAAAGNPLADIGAGNYPAGVTGDTIIGYADFIRL